MVPKYWIGVVSQSHVERGVAGGFCQLCHGKATPLKRMKKGDWLIYYSPKTDMNQGTPLQSFTAIGTVIGEKAYEFEMTPDFRPFRLDVAYEKSAKVTKIAPLLGQLSFIQSLKNPAKWGILFRRGQFEIPKSDFELISSAMGIQ
ncbi:PUA-like domain-containing protein [Obelidium mucronatum]|nr:PUA-like domain-containing protein [Obelidium mucronatum]